MLELIHEGEAGPLYLLAHLFNGNLLSFKGQWDFDDWITHYNHLYGSSFKENID